MHQDHMRPRLLMLCPLALLAIPACTQFPELDETQTAALDAASYPALVPIEPIIAGIDAPAETAVETEAAFDARLSGLRARADRLRGTVLSTEERRRLEAGLR